MEQEDDFSNNQSLKLAAGLDRVGYLVRRVRDALSVLWLTPAAIEEFTHELMNFVSESVRFKMSKPA